MTILIVGAGGQIGQELALRLPDSVAVDRRGLDVTDGSAVDRVVADVQPTVVINASAYTAVDRAEDEPDLATAVNDRAVERLAASTDRAGAWLVHISTDYVFDGQLGRPYVESDPPTPIGVYGRSKLAGEGHVRSLDRGVVVRTSWVYGSRAPNFVRTMLRLATEREEIGVVNDQFGCPTSAADVSDGLSRFTRLLADGRRPANDLYHLASPESASWFDLAKATLEASAAGFSGTLRPLTTADYPTRAERPADTRLDSGQIKAEFGIVLPSWRLSLPPIVADLEGA